MRTGNNIRQRKDGRFEARYEKGRDENGRIIYGYCYASSYEEADAKRQERIGEKQNPRQMNLLVLGAGDHGIEVKDLAGLLRIFHDIKFLDDEKQAEYVIGPCIDFKKYVKDYPIAIPAVGNSSIRCKWFKELMEAGFIMPVFIHPSANISSDVQIGIGTVVCAGSTVGHNAIIGRGCIIDSGAVVERNAVVPDWTLVNCGEIFSNKKQK